MLESPSRNACVNVNQSLIVVLNNYVRFIIVIRPNIQYTGNNPPLKS